MSLYKESAQFLNGFSSTKALQNKIFELHGQKKLKSNPKQVFALVINALKYRRFIEQVIKKSKILELEKTLKREVCILMVYDLCFTRSGRIQCGKTPLKETLLKHKTRLNAEVTKLKLKNKVANVQDLVDHSELDKDETPVRWFRANTVKTSLASLLKEFGHLKRVDSFQELKIGTIYHDEYVPNLFGVHPREKITKTDAYLKGRLIIQDRSSCFPAFILNPQPKVDKVIDGCAAPGNKTTHLASILQNTPKSVILFERDQRRCKILKTMCEKAGALKCISVQQGDFTQTNPSDYEDVTGLILDPSCSGSGIFGRAVYDADSKSNDEEETKQEVDTARLSKLSSFQYTIMKHALSFPNARRVVYSTCSIHLEENERVVIDLLRDPQVQSQGWKLCRRDQVIPTWPRRGFKEEFAEFENGDELAEGLIRSEPKVDGGIGFFAACFERSLGQDSAETGAKSQESAESDENSQDEGDWTGFDD